MSDTPSDRPVPRHPIIRRDALVIRRSATPPQRFAPYEARNRGAAIQLPVDDFHDVRSNGRAAVDPFQTAAELIRIAMSDEAPSLQPQTGRGRRGEQGVITSGRVIPSVQSGTEAQNQEQTPSISTFGHVVAQSTLTRSTSTLHGGATRDVNAALNTTTIRRSYRRRDVVPQVSFNVRATIGANRLLKEAEMVRKDSPLGCHAAPKDDDLYEWAAVIEGPSGTVYEGGTYFCHILIPSDYPFNPPKVQFLTRIYHCNISMEGDVCVDILNEKWKSTMSITTVLQSLLSLMFQCNPEDALVSAIADQYRTDRAAFERTARIWTRRYGTMGPPPVGVAARSLWKVKC